ncbi:cyclophane-forming radical SAM/SPASM peptide maturase YhhB [Streptomyces sp. B1866]|uniref:cyclophane-forming radical SAM/SPASM peptide maturase YhhB n=1 Tax=Streptomyces sp. B1866 TaxID=3075431 RepID=UPI00288F750E|nr:cyclophane-forming radical SAM/SPASM peptide maturase YhhB [Streptomyces sp. B1866]MDT3399612.1 cyclophane-forming radical SAM/SPASM peptide maturase YhhB [Streptomyces sp. B1866]
MVKTASRCNLDCSYCYVYNLGDEGWKSQPRLMTDAVMSAVIDQLSALSQSQSHPLSVVLHGGEPLLLGIGATERFVEGLKLSLRADAGLHIQTNGVLLTDEFIDVFDRYDVGISISLDGPAELHDRNRRDRHGDGSHERVVAGVARLVAHPASERLFSGLLAVVDPTSDPIEVYEFLKATGAPSFDFLYRDGNHDALPPGKSQTDSTEYGDWMVRLLDHYLADLTPPRIRVLDDLIRLILGGRGRKEGIGQEEYGILVIDTDGRITRNDTLKAAYPGADRFQLERSIVNRDLLDQLAGTELDEYFALQHPTSPTCEACPELTVCGGGMPAHRWSTKNGYSNPTVFCSDQLTLISALRSRLSIAAKGKD